MIFRYRYSLDECGLLNMHLTKCIDDCSIGVLTNILPLLVVYLPIFWFHDVCYYHSGCNDICHFRIYSYLCIGLILIQPFEISILFLIVRWIDLKAYDKIKKSLDINKVFKHDKATNFDICSTLLKYK